MLAHVGRFSQSEPEESAEEFRFSESIDKKVLNFVTFKTDDQAISRVRENEMNRNQQIAAGKIYRLGSKRDRPKFVGILSCSLWSLLIGKAFINLGVAL